MECFFQDLDSEPEAETKTVTPMKSPAPNKRSPFKNMTKPAPTPVKQPHALPDTSREDEEIRRAEELRRSKELQRRRDEEAERVRLAAEKLAKQKADEEAMRKLKAEKEAAEQNTKEEEENRLLQEKKEKDDALKAKLAAMRKNAGGDDFMSQLKAKKNTPSTSPNPSPVKSETVKSPGSSTSERLTKKSGSGDDLRKAAALNTVNGRRKKSEDEDEGSGYQPSFASARPTAGKVDPFGVELGNSEYSPSFSNNQRISSRESSQSKEKVWTPAGRATTVERIGNGLTNGSSEQKPVLKRRQSRPKNVIPVKSYEADDDLEELHL